MQTFVPLPSFTDSARVHDNKRLGKQRVESLELLVILSGIKPDWMSAKWYARCLRHKNHPAVRMWRGYEHVLYMQYMACIVSEWLQRGNIDTTYEKARLIYKATDWSLQSLDLPSWLTPEFCAAHRSNLLRKNPSYYKQFGWTEPNNLLYIWPV